MGSNTCSLGFKSGVRSTIGLDLEELLEDDPAADPGPVASEGVARVLDRTAGKQRGELVPEGLQQP
jgi:hypothetical protein